MPLAEGGEKEIEREGGHGQRGGGSRGTGTRVKTGERKREREGGGGEGRRARRVAVVGCNGKRGNVGGLGVARAAWNGRWQRTAGN